MENLLPVRTSNFTAYTLQANTNEQVMRTLVPSGGSAIALYSFAVDVADWLADGNIEDGAVLIFRINQRIDGVNYRTVVEVAYVAGQSRVVPAFFNYVFGTSRLQITVQSTVAVSGVLSLYPVLVTGGIVTES